MGIQLIHNDRIYLKDKIVSCFDKMIEQEGYKYKKLKLIKLRNRYRNCRQFYGENGFSRIYDSCNLFGICPFCSNYQNFKRLTKIDGKFERNIEQDSTLFWCTLTSPNSKYPNDYKYLFKALTCVIEERNKSLKRKSNKLLQIERIRGVLAKHEFTISDDLKYNHHLHVTLVALPNTVLESFDAEFRKIWNKVSKVIDENRYRKRVGKPWKMDPMKYAYKFNESFKSVHQYLWKIEKETQTLYDKIGEELRGDSVISKFVEFFISRSFNKDKSQRVKTLGYLRGNIGRSFKNSVKRNFENKLLIIAQSNGQCIV